MRSVFLALAFAFVLGGCASHAEIEANIMDRISPISMDQFVMKYGAPAGPPVYEMSDGTKVYRFVVGTDNFQFHTPATTTTTGYVDYFGNVHTTSTTAGGHAYNFELECQILAMVNASGEVTSVKIERDTGGIWKFSRCDEMF